MRRRKTFPEEAPGRSKGRVVLDNVGSLLPFKTHHGEENTRDAFKNVFGEWHNWALKQTEFATWYGADESLEGVAGL